MWFGLFRAPNTVNPKSVLLDSETEPDPRLPWDTRGPVSKQVFGRMGFRLLCGLEWLRCHV